MNIDLNWCVVKRQIKALPTPAVTIVKMNDLSPLPPSNELNCLLNVYYVLFDPFHLLNIVCVYTFESCSVVGTQILLRKPATP